MTSKKIYVVFEHVNTSPLHAVDSVWTDLDKAKARCVWLCLEYNTSEFAVAVRELDDEKYELSDESDRVVEIDGE